MTADRENLVRMARDWQAIATREAADQLGTPEGAARLVEAKRYGLLADVLTQPPSGEVPQAEEVKRLADEYAFAQAAASHDTGDIEDQRNADRQRETLHTAIDSLAADVERLREDAERLDWCQRSLAEVYQDCSENFSVKFIDGDGGFIHSPRKKTLREAIDAARSLPSHSQKEVKE